MPLVIVNQRRDRFGRQSIQHVVEGLPEVIAKALSSSDPDGALTAHDIELWTRDARDDGLDQPLLSKGEFDIQIIIFANAYPERVKNIHQRRAQIQQWLAQNTPAGIKGYVWILPQQDTSFGAFLSSRPYSY